MMIMIIIIIIIYSVACLKGLILRKGEKKREHLTSQLGGYLLQFKCNAETYSWRFLHYFWPALINHLFTLMTLFPINNDLRQVLLYFFHTNHRFVLSGFLDLQTLVSVHRVINAY